jgi:Uma2 family endonuclease
MTPDISAGNGAMATTKLTTIDDLWQIEEPGRYALIRGELYHMPPAGGEHGEIETNLILEIGSYVRDRQLGRVYTGDTGFILSRESNTWLSPDVAYVQADRLPEGRRQGFLPLAPDLAVEIVSPSDLSSLVTAKVIEYLAAGTRLVWVIEPEQRVITAYTPDRNARVYTETDEIDCGDVLPGFRVRVGDLFQ